MTSTVVLKGNLQILHRLGTFYTRQTVDKKRNIFKSPKQKEYISQFRIELAGIETTFGGFLEKTQYLAQLARQRKDSVWHSDQKPRFRAS